MESSTSYATPDSDIRADARPPDRASTTAFFATDWMEGTAVSRERMLRALTVTAGEPGSRSLHGDSAHPLVQGVEVLRGELRQPHQHAVRRPQADVAPRDVRRGAIEDDPVVFSARPRDPESLELRPHHGFQAEGRRDNARVSNLAHR